MGTIVGDVYKTFLENVGQRITVDLLQDRWNLSRQQVHAAVYALIKRHGHNIEVLQPSEVWVYHGPTKTATATGPAFSPEVKSAVGLHVVRDTDNGIEGPPHPTVSHAANFLRIVATQQTGIICEDRTGKYYLAKEIK